MTAWHPTATTMATPFPSGSVIVLALVLTINGYTLANLFPYVGFFVKHLLGLSTANDAGYYAGYVASAFTFGRFLTAYLWGNASDTIGNKTVIIIGLWAIVTCSIAFGLSTNFAMAVASRFILGLMNGIMAAARTSTREICGPEHAVTGLNYVSGSRGIGLVIGTAIGGLLAQPASAYPKVFSPTGVFATYPFLLPNLFGGGLALLVLPLVCFVLPETRMRSKPGFHVVPSREASLNSKSFSVARRQRKTEGRGQSEYQALNTEGDEEQQQQPQRSQDQVPNGQRKGAAFSKAGTGYGTADYRCAGLPPAMELIPPSGNKGRQMANGYLRLKDDDEHGVEATLTSNGSCGGGDKEECRPHHTEDRNAGVFGAAGLLATPNVNMVMIMAALCQIVVIGYEEAYPLWAVSTTGVGGLGWTPKDIGKVLTVTGGILTFLTFGVVPRLIKMMGIVNLQRTSCVIGVLVFLAVPYAKSLSWNMSSLFAVSALSNVLVMCSTTPLMLALTVAATGMVPENQRGKLGGLFMTAESLGRFIGPASFSNMFAWSISPSVRGWVGCTFVFCVSATIMAALVALSWRTIPLVILPRPAERGESGDEPEGGSGTNASYDDARDPVWQALVSSPGGVKGWARQDEGPTLVVGSSQQRVEDGNGMLGPFA